MTHLRSLTNLIFCCLLSGCTLLIDGLAQKNAPDYAVLKLPMLDPIFKSQHIGQWRNITLCESLYIESNSHNTPALRLTFDCQLSDIDIKKYKEVFSKYHPLLINIIKNSLLASHLFTDDPLCLTVINNNSQFLRFHRTKPCIHLTVPHVDYVSTSKRSVESGFEPDTFFAMKVLGDYYQPLFHELYHAKTQSNQGNSETSQFWIINEYQAYLVANFIDVAITNKVNGQPISYAWAKTYFNYRLRWRYYV